MDNLINNEGSWTENALYEAMFEVAHTVLSNPDFFPAQNQLDVRVWVSRLFPKTSASQFEHAFLRLISDPELPWGKLRFCVIKGLRQA